MIAEVFDTMTTTIYNNKIPSSSLLSCMYVMSKLNAISEFPFEITTQVTVHAELDPALE